MKYIYIAGKVTGLPWEEVVLKFHEAQTELESRGFSPVNPIKVVNDPLATWEDAMKKCIRALTRVDAVYLLPCCSDSPGAKMEIAIAAKLRIPAFKKVDELYQITILEEYERRRNSY